LRPRGRDPGAEPRSVRPESRAGRARLGPHPRPLADDEIATRHPCARIAGAAHVAEEGIALRPVHVDAVCSFDHGFPRRRGGSPHHADTPGAGRTVARIAEVAPADPLFRRAPDPSADMARTVCRFADLDPAIRD